MKRKDDASWPGSERRSAVRALWAAVGGGVAVFLAVVLPAPARAQTLSGASVQLGQTSLTLPPGPSGTVYIYGMGTGGARPATNFAQGPYTLVTDQGGEVVAGLAMTQSNVNSFTTQCADYTIAGIAVSGFKTVNASYAASNQLHPTLVSDTFLVTGPAVAVIFAIAGGEDHVEQIQGLPNFQIDAQKGPDQSHGIAIVIGHANLQPGRYTVAEITEGDPGRDPAHEGDLIGVFVFTGGSGIATVVPSGPNPGPPTLNGQSTGPGLGRRWRHPRRLGVPSGPNPGPPPSNVPPTGPPPAPPPTPLVRPVPPYIFNGAYAAYRLRAGAVSAPLRVTLSDIDLTQRTGKVTATFGGSLSSLSDTEQVNFDDNVPALDPPNLELAREGRLPTDISLGNAKVLPNVRVSVPAGTFITEELISSHGTIWFDGRSGIPVEWMGSSGRLARIPGGPVTGSFIMELTGTNVPMSSTGSSALIYEVGGAVILLVLVLFGYGLVRRAPRLAAATATTPIAAAPALRVSSASASSGEILPGNRAALTSEALDRLAKLKELLEAGLITAEEFQEQKTKLLG